jgi:thiamine transporter
VEARRVASRRTSILVEAALCIALAAVLAQVRLWRMPMGGTVSMEMLPLFVFALRRGVGPGVFAGAAYGTLNYFFDPYAVHWAQVLLDYPVAHSMVGLAGLFANAWRRTLERSAPRALAVAAVPGMILGALARFGAHWLSGLVFFASAAQGQPAWLYSLVYNGSYMAPSLVACVAAGLLLLPSLERAVPPR